MLIFITLFKIASVSAQNLPCDNTILYGYGKLYYNNAIHDKEDIYPLTQQNKYNTLISLEKDEYNSSSKNNNSTLEVNIDGLNLKSTIIIRIAVKNKIKQTLIIPKKNLAFENNLFNPIFHITTECILLDYIGQTVNFGNEYKYPDDFIIINAYETYHTEVHLEKYYKLPPGVKQYEISIPEIPFSTMSDHKQGKESIISSNKIFLTIESPLK